MTVLGVELAPEVAVDRVATLGARAEDVGFDAAFVSGHHFNRDPIVALDRVAAATDALDLGPGVANPYDVHPVRLASQVATLDEASGGRALCGIGAGDRSALRALGVERDRPLRRVLETMRVARRLWSGERVSHEGTFVARDAGIEYADAVGDVPVYVGAQGPDMLRMAAKHADGVLYNAAHPTDVAWAADRIEEGLAAREREGAFDFAVYASVSVADDADAAREAARKVVAFIASGAAEPTLDRHGIDPERAAAIGRAIEAGEFREAFSGVTERMLDAFCIAGTPETVAQGAAAALADADSFVAASPLGPDRERALSLAGAALGRVAGE